MKVLTGSGRVLCALALFLLNSFGLGLLAQSQPTMIDPTLQVFGEAVGAPLLAEWKVTNATEVAMTIYVERNFVQTVEPFNYPYVAGAEGAYERFCWGGTCFPYGADSSPGPLALTLQPGDTTGLNFIGTEEWFIADYYPNGVAGVTALEYCFIPTGQGQDELCHTVLYCADAENCVLGVQEMKTEISGFAPNPVVGLAGLAYTAPNGGHLVFLDLTGRAVKRIALNEGRGVLWINGEEFDPGVYMYALEVAGQLSQSRKLVIEH
jgi:hypothetical protein